MKPETNLSAIPPNKPSRFVIPDASRVQDEVVLVETVGVTRLHPDYYTLRTWKPRAVWSILCLAALQGTA